VHQELKIITPKKASFREVKNQVQIRMHFKDFYLPPQVDAIYTINDGVLILRFLNGRSILCKIKVKVKSIDSPINVNTMSSLSQQVMARFEFISEKDEFAMVVMNSKCFKRL
jgi:hypothetical protein